MSDSESKEDLKAKIARLEKELAATKSRERSQANKKEQDQDNERIPGTPPRQASPEKETVIPGTPPDSPGRPLLAQSLRSSKYQCESDEEHEERVLARLQKDIVPQMPRGSIFRSMSQVKAAKVKSAKEQDTRARQKKRGFGEIVSTEPKKQVVVTKPTEPRPERDLRNKTPPKETPEYFATKSHGVPVAKDIDQSSNLKKGEDIVEPFFKYKLSSQYLSFQDLHQQFYEELADCRLYNLSRLCATVCPPTFDAPTDANWIVFAVVAHKSKVMHATLPSGNRRAGARPEAPQPFMMLTLTDLGAVELSLALQGAAFDRYWKLREGSLVALLNPAVYMTKARQARDAQMAGVSLHDTVNGNQPSFTGSAPPGPAFALRVSHADNSILEIGRAKDFARCAATTARNLQCQRWVNAAHATYCDYHTEQRTKAARAQRLEMNSMGQGGAGGGRTMYATMRVGKGGRLALNSKGYDTARKQGLLPDTTRRPQHVRDTGPGTGGYSTVYVAPPAALRPFDASYIETMPAQLEAGMRAHAGAARQALNKARDSELVARLKSAPGAAGDVIRSHLGVTISQVAGMSSDKRGGKKRKDNDGDGDGDNDRDDSELVTGEKLGPFKTEHIRRIGFDPLVRPGAFTNGHEDGPSKGSQELATKLRRIAARKEIDLSMGPRRKHKRPRVDEKEGSIVKPITAKVPPMDIEIEID
ncbi:uncharacterized protein SAPINGB_P000983 [Magnusiomyces paraingens]|uniref:Uncharacterized protein n=1 Tax=Magnusiomyces paraingens TaxID=2606893 RepID=A0A5E8B559_9ASCO|nr:uncharacterized protein SAPINGB_P000983 [Saprochaete ingens]VVT45973.1 unnamed protein product [Saprochaete ingens]